MNRRTRPDPSISIRQFDENRRRKCCSKTVRDPPGAAIRRAAMQPFEARSHPYGWLEESLHTYCLRREKFGARRLVAMNKISQGDFPNPVPSLVHRASGNISIDGQLNEEAWKKASTLNFFVHKTHEKPLSRTEAKILWDEEFLYVGFDALDKDVWSYMTERDSQRV
jgi:hypothetical protein